MDPEVLQDLYDRAVSKGYTKTLEDFALLLQSDDEVLQDTFQYVQQQGYAKSIDDFGGLVGVKKKDETNMDSELEAGSLVSQDSEPTEEDYFQGVFGDILRGVDTIVPLGIGDFVDDMARSIASGYYQGVAAEDASDLLLRGSSATEEDISSFLESQKKTQTYGPSKEMQEYMKIYEDNDKSFMGVVLGLLNSGATIIPELVLSSMTSMATNTDSLAAAGTALATGAGIGASGGAVAGGVGALPGAIGGAAAAIPYAFAAAGSALEMGATFSELLQEEAEGETLDAEKIKEILNDPEKYASIRNKAVARGLTIGAIDAYTGKLGGKLASKVLTKGGKQASKIASKARTTGAVATAAGVEGVGGSVGEVAGRVAADQEMDISEIVLEGLAEMPGGIKDIVSTRFSVPTYKINGDRVTAEQVDEMIETMTLEQLQKSNIKIDNDYDGRAGKLQDRIIELSAKEQIQEANPNLNEPTVDALTALQVELDGLKNNKTQPAKERSSQIKKQMTELENNQLPDTAVVEQVETDQVQTEPAVETVEQVSEETPATDSFFGEEVLETTEVVDDNLSINKAGVKEEIAPERQTLENTIVGITKKAAKALSSMLPNTKIIIHNTQDQYLKYADEGRAQYIFNPTTNEGVIHINLSEASLTTAPHEIFHAVLFNKLKNVESAGGVSDLMMNSVRKTLADNDPLAVQIDQFANEYQNQTALQNEERLAELMGLMSSEYQNLTPPQKNTILEFIKSLANQIGFNFEVNQFTQTDQDVINLLNTLSTKVAEGKEIVAEDVTIIETLEGDQQVPDQQGQVTRQQRTVQDIAREYNMDNQGFIPKTANESQLLRAVEPLGYGVRRSRETQFGQGGGLFLTRNGRKVNPFQEVRRQQKAPKKPTTAPTSIVGNITDPKKITSEQRRKSAEALEKIQEGSRTPESAYKKASRLLAKEVKELVKQGVITTKQMTDVMARFANVTMFNPVSRENFLNYMSRVFANKEYASKISFARKNKNKAKKNAGRKIGKADALVPQLQRLFTVNPSLIPEPVFDTYMSLVEMFSKSRAVLDLPSITEVTQQTEEVLKQLDEERSMVIDLTDRFNETKSKVKDKEGKVDYEATIKKMLDNNEITEDEYQVMKKYRTQINPRTLKEPKTDAEIEAERKKLVKEIKNSPVLKISQLNSRDEQELAGKFERLINSPAINDMSIQELNNILRLIDNINNGYLPHLTQVTVEKLNSINKGKELSGAIQKAKPLTFSAIYAKIKRLVTRSKRSSLEELIRRNPLFYIDQVFGDFDTKTIFNSLFDQAAKGLAAFRFEFKVVENAIEKASNKVLKSLGSDPNKYLMSKYKQMAYMIENEFKSNPNNPQVNSVVDFLKATIERIDEGRTRYSQQDADMLQDILNTYTNKEGEFNLESLYDSFNTAEKESIDAIYKINKENFEKAGYTSTIIRGQEFNPLNNYVHLNVLPDGKESSVMGEVSIIDAYNKSLRPSTKATSLIERTGDVSPLNFDVYASAARGAKGVLMDYHLTEPIRTGRRTLNQARKDLKESGPDNRLPAKQRDILNAIESAYDEAVENLLINSFGENTVVDQALNYLQKTGYRSILAGAGRFVAESTSNISFALITDPKGFIAGAKLSGVISEDGSKIMNNLDSKQTTRLFGEGLNTRYIDTSIIEQPTGVTGGRAKNQAENFVLKLWNKTGQKWIKGVETTADYLISTPDKAIMRPMWFGAFENRFKEITGRKPDFEKIAADDQAYMEANREALEQATELADKRSVLAGATDNAFMGMLKGTSKPNQSATLKAFNAFNNFMTRFLIFEYITARTGVMSLIGKGELSKTQGGALLGAVTSRMVLYTLLGQMLAEGMTSLFDDDEDPYNLIPEESDMKSPEKMLGQAFASTFTSLLFGRDFGNATKSIINLGIEELNESQLQFLRDGEYDPYKDALQYTIIPKTQSGKGTDIGALVKRVGAAYGPILGTADLLIQALTEDTKKTESARERQEQENFIRLPLELLGNLGFVPLYKDVRKIVLDQLYGDLSRAKKQLRDKRKAKKEMLQGYDSESDMKRYDPELWERTFGPNSEGYEEREALKEIERQQRKIRREQKDALYNYTPKKKKKKKKKSSGRFGGGGSVIKKKKKKKSKSIF